MPSRSVERGAALGLLAVLLAALGTVGWSWVDSYADGQREIADKQTQLRNLRDLADARAGFARLTRKNDTGPLILSVDANPQDALATLIGHAAEGQEILLDGTDAMPAEPTLVSATVRLRGTQSGLHGFLHAIEGGTPMLVVTRLDLDVFRAADVDRGRPLILRADMRVAALVAPAAAPRPAVAGLP